MDQNRKLIRRIGLLFGLSLVAGSLAVSCQAPTQVQLVLRSDLICGAPGSEGYGLRDIHVYAGPTKESVRARIGQKADAILESCNGAPGELGRIVLYREASDTAYVQIVASLARRNADGSDSSRAAETCPTSPKTQAEADKCLVASRQFTYTRHTTGYVAVTLEQSCIPEWWKCGEDESCIDGRCQSAKVDPTKEEPPPLQTRRDAGVADASIVDASAPDAIIDAAPVDASTSNVPIQIAAGEGHTCVLHGQGGVRCWGYGAQGSLGYGDGTTRGAAPGTFGMGSKLPWIDLGGPAKSIFALGPRTCAVMKTGGAKCWGYDGNPGEGVLGYPELAVRHRGLLPGDMGNNLPMLDLGIGDIAEIRFGVLHGCARDITGKLRCWGGNPNGQLGLEDPASYYGTAVQTYRTIPSPFPGRGLNKILAVGTGWQHTCAIVDVSANVDAAAPGVVVQCWGNNDSGSGPGSLGLGDLTTRGLTQGSMANITVNVGGTPVELSVGAFHSCARLQSGSVACWGNNTHGQLGTGTPNFYGGPIDETIEGEFYGAMPPPSVSLGAGHIAIAIASGANHTCALLDNKTVKCWGLNSSGQLGLGDKDIRGKAATGMGDNLPAVNLGGPVKQIACGGKFGNAQTAFGHTCALLENGDVKCWGDNTYGQLGRENTTVLDIPPTNPIDLTLPP